MTARWINELTARSERPDVDAFLAEIVEVCRKHKLSISHEDQHGNFEIEEFYEQNVRWLLKANDARKQNR